MYISCGGSGREGYVAETHQLLLRQIHCFSVVILLYIFVIVNYSGYRTA